MRLTVSDILKCGVEARLPVGSPDTAFEGASVDSREIVEGGLFVGVRGAVSDGGQHAPDALRDGAAAAVVGESAWRWIEGDVQGMRRPVMVAPDPVAVLQAAGRLALERSGARVIGITGATGKTTTKDILLAMLRAAGVAAEGTPGNRNTEVGVPMSLLGLPEGTEVAVVEMGMRGPGQIAELARLAPPVVACITAIGPVHLELLGTVEAVAAAKAEILAALPPSGTAVVPDDEPLLEPFLADLDPSVTVIRFGAEPDISLDLSLSKAWERRNAAAALACCRAIGAVPPEGSRIEVGLSPLRGQERPLPAGGTLIEDCYNANPMAMRAAIADLAGRSGRRVAVLGDMRELGAEEDRYHREIGEAAAAAGIDLLVAVGPLAAGYAAGADGVRSVHIATVEEAVEALPALVEPGDVVLLKGSRGLALERVGAALAPAG
jgi:UDP-N-acetylmuramoyl-tripeptide--D-alanyl-D-alanine ligase